MGSITITMIQDFSSAPLGADLVVFSGTKQYLSQQEAGRHLARAVRYAEEHKVFVVTDRFAAGKRLCLGLISPEGEPAGLQCATGLHLSLKNDFRPSDEIAVFDLPFGRLALCVDADINSPVYPRLARMRGADLLVVSQYIDSFDHDPCRSFAGEWSAAQSAAMPVVNAGNLYCSACVPVSCTGDGSGYLLPPQEQYPGTVLIPEAALRAEMPMQPSPQLWRAHFAAEQQAETAVLEEKAAEPADPNATMEIPPLREQAEAGLEIAQIPEPQPVPEALFAPAEEPETVEIPEKEAAPAVEEAQEAASVQEEAPEEAPAEEHPEAVRVDAAQPEQAADWTDGEEPDYDHDLMRELGLEDIPAAPPVSGKRNKSAAGREVSNEIDHLLEQLGKRGARIDPEVSRYLSQYAEVEE